VRRLVVAFFFKPPSPPSNVPAATVFYCHIRDIIWTRSGWYGAGAAVADRWGSAAATFGAIGSAMNEVCDSGDA
jgi:hypothetical protein